MSQACTLCQPRRMSSSGNAFADVNVMKHAARSSSGVRYSTSVSRRYSRPNFRRCEVVTHVSRIEAPASCDLSRSRVRGGAVSPASPIPSIYAERPVAIATGAVSGWFAVASSSLRWTLAAPLSYANVGATSTWDRRLRGVCVRYLSGSAMF